jgi:hypothetical protein
MSHFAFRHLRLLGPLTLAATLTLTTPVMAQDASSISFEIGNPSPGDTIHVGSYLIEGVAFDREAPEGTGIDRVEVFLENRDTGGVLLGEGNLGTENVLRDNGEDSVMMIAPVIQDAEQVWTATLTLSANQTGSHSLFFYAHSAITGAESIVTMPVTVAP